MDFLADLREIVSTFGPTVGLAVIAFFFLDRKDVRAADTVASIVKSHREDFSKLQEKSERNISDMAEGYREDLQGITKLSEARNEKLVVAINDMSRNIKCQIGNRGIL